MAAPDWQRTYCRIPEPERRAFERANAHRLLREIDKGHGQCVLKQRPVREALSSALRFFHGERCWSGDFVIMPNHVHWLTQPFQSRKLESLVGSIKRFTATHADTQRQRLDRLWQRESHDRLVRDRAELGRIRRYIQSNPTKAGPREDCTYYRADWLDA